MIGFFDPQKSTLIRPLYHMLSNRMTEDPIVKGKKEDKKETKQNNRTNNL